MVIVSKMTWINICFSLINVRENRRVNHDWTIQRLGNIGNTRPRTRTNNQEIQHRKLKRWATRTLPKTGIVCTVWTHIIARTSYVTMRWCLCTRTTRLKLYRYSDSSLKQHSVGRHVASLGHIWLIPYQLVCGLSL